METIDASGPATEQSWIFVGASEPTSENSSGPPTPDIDVSRPLQIPIIEVAFSKRMWLSIPQEMSAELFSKFKAGQDAGYTWDMGNSRK